MVMQGNVSLDFIQKHLSLHFNEEKNCYYSWISGNDLGLLYNGGLRIRNDYGYSIVILQPLWEKDKIAKVINIITRHKSFKSYFIYFIYILEKYLKKLYESIFVPIFALLNILLWLIISLLMISMCIDISDSFCDDDISNNSYFINYSYSYENEDSLYLKMNSLPSPNGSPLGGSPGGSAGGSPGGFPGGNNDLALTLSNNDDNNNNNNDLRGFRSRSRPINIPITNEISIQTQTVSPIVSGNNTVNNINSNTSIANSDQRVSESPPSLSSMASSVTRDFIPTPNIGQSDFNDNVNLSEGLHRVSNYVWKHGLLEYIENLTHVDQDVYGNTHLPINSTTPWDNGILNPNEPNFYHNKGFNVTVYNGPNNLGPSGPIIKAKSIDGIDHRYCIFIDRDYIIRPSYFYLDPQGASTYVELGLQYYFYPINDTEDIYNCTVTYPNTNTILFDDMNTLRNFTQWHKCNILQLQNHQSVYWIDLFGEQAARHIATFIKENTQNHSLECAPFIDFGLERYSLDEEHDDMEF